MDFGSIITNDTNYKDQLLRLYQSLYHSPPKYKEICSEGPLHNRSFTMGVLSHDGTVLASAIAKNKQDAEQEASQLALIKLGALNLK